MAQTAKDMPRDQWRNYHPADAIRRRQQSPDPRTERRFAEAQQLAREAAKRLRERFGATRVVLFGSGVDRSLFTRWSDVDLAAWGLAPERFYAALASVDGISSDIRVELIDGETCRQGLRRIIEREGVEL